MIDRREHDARLREAAAAIAAALPVAFLVVGALRAYPFLDDVNVPAKTPDDWHTYKQLALSVVRDGVSMPALSTTYAGLPHGFLYIYFVALMFAVTGVNSTHVYVVQSFLLGLSISLTYAAIRARVTAVGGLMFLLALTALMYVDAFRNLTFKLLSENLYFLLYPLLLIFLYRSVEQDDGAPHESFAAGVLLGLVVLARPSFVLSAAMLIAAAWIHAVVGRQSLRSPVLLSLGSAIAASGVALRNYAVARRATFDIVTDTSDWLRLWNLPPSDAVIALAKRTLFVFGFTQPIAPQYRLRPHWMILWLLWAIYPLVRLRRQQPFEFWELLLYVYVIAYVAPLVLVAADITSYGGRMVVVILPLLLVPAFRLFFASSSAVTHVRH